MKAFTEQMLVNHWPSNIDDMQEVIEFQEWASGFLTGCLEGGAGVEVMDEIEMLGAMLNTMLFDEEAA